MWDVGYRDIPHPISNILHPTSTSQLMTDFSSVDMRVGTVLTAETFPEARKPALKLTIDFGPELGVKRSSAQLTVHYKPEQLVGRQVVAAVNLGTRRIATFDSEVLVLGAMPQATEVVLLAPDQRVANGTRIG